MNIQTVSDAVELGIVSAGKCLPTNDTLSTTLGGPLADLAGAFWGLTPWIVGGMLAILALGVIFTSMTPKASKLIKAMIIVAGVVIGVWFVAMLVFAISGNQPDVPFCPF